MAMKLTTGKRIAETSSKGNQEKWRETWACQSGPTPLRNLSLIHISEPTRH